MAADLGITAESLRTWVRKDEAQAVPEGRDGSVSAAEELARLRAENARLLKAEQEWRLEREVTAHLANTAAPMLRRAQFPRPAAVNRGAQTKKKRARRGATGPLPPRHRQLARPGGWPRIVQS